MDIPCPNCGRIGKLKNVKVLPDIVRCPECKEKFNPKLSQEPAILKRYQEEETPWYDEFLEKEILHCHIIKQWVLWTGFFIWFLSLAGMLFAPIWLTRIEYALLAITYMFGSVLYGLFFWAIAHMLVVAAARLHLLVEQARQTRRIYATMQLENVR